MLAAHQPADPQRVQLRLGRAALKVDDRRVATAALHKVYYDYPLTVEAAEAREELDKIDAPNPPTPPTKERVQLDLGRAERLYGAGRYADARKAYESLRALAAGDERQLTDLRLGECDSTSSATPPRMRPSGRTSTVAHRLQEAQSFYLNIRELGRKDEYLTLVRTFVDAYPGSRARRGRAERARHVLHPRERGREGGGSVRRDLPAIPARRRSPIAPRGRPAGGRTGTAIRRDRSYLRVGGGHIPARGLPAVVALLGGAVAPAIGTSKPPKPASAGHRRLPQLVLRPAAMRRGRAPARRRRPAGAARPCAGTTRTLPPTIDAGVPPPNAPLIRALLAAGLYDDAIARTATIAARSGRRRCSTRPSHTR